MTTIPAEKFKEWYKEYEKESKEEGVKYMRKHGLIMSIFEYFAIKSKEYMEANQ